MLSVPFKYLIVRSQFFHKKIKRPFHFYIDLEESGDLRYQDYLVAMGANYKIDLDEQGKWWTMRNDIFSDLSKGEKIDEDNKLVDKLIR